MSEISLDAWLEDKEFESNALPDPTAEDVTSRDVQIDLEQAVEQIPPHLVLLLVDLRMLTISEISHRTKTPRSTLYYGTLSELRRSLKERGFAEYLHEASDSF